jgi:antitoxin component YwqK of YwqJK toxin-antitoxin module
LVWWAKLCWEQVDTWVEDLQRPY